MFKWASTPCAPPAASRKAGAPSPHCGEPGWSESREPTIRLITTGTDRIQAKRAWGATRRATDALVLARTGGSSPRHAVADAGLVEDVGGVVRAFAKLAAEVLHHGPHRPRMPGVSGAPQRLQQVIMGHDAAATAERDGRDPLRLRRSPCRGW